MRAAVYSLPVTQDKLIGALARHTDAHTSAAWRQSEVLLAITSHASHEIVHKAATAGIAVIAAISAPASLAIEPADNAQVTSSALRATVGLTRTRMPGIVAGARLLTTGQ